MRKLFINICAFVLLIQSCKPPAEPLTIKAVSGEGAEALSPYFTLDNKGNAVLCWTERDPADSLYRVKYAVFDSKNSRFKRTISVETTAGTTPNAESMNKVAFKSDGTVIVVFGKKFKNQKNPYAGGICYSMSADGDHWSAPKYLHSDTAHNYGRSFFDITRLKNGEVAAIWLDGRFGKTEPGSALFFAKTIKGAGFGPDKCIAKSTCECCRTALSCDNAGNIHIAYRSILFPPALLGKQVRDMVYTVSYDEGQKFSSAKPISRDNWIIEGCPHTGPSLATSLSAVNALWFTAGGNPGLYYSRLPAGGADFSNKLFLTATGRHPQLVSLKDGSTAMVWEEEVQAVAPSNKSGKHEHSGIGHSTVLSANARIVLTYLKNGQEERKIITEGVHPEHHAVIISVNNGELLGWVREENGRPRIYSTYIKD